MTFIEHMQQEPFVIRQWINWMVFINLSGIVFAWKRVEPRWVVAAFVASAALMNVLFYFYGYEKILGLSHLIFWTPLLVYLYFRRSEIGQHRITAIYLGTVFTTNAISLGFDVFDVVSYGLGSSG